MLAELSRISMRDYPRLLDGLRKSPPELRIARCRNLARTDLYFLLRYALRRADMEHPWLFARCREVGEAPNGRIDLWAREHYKSTIITFGLTIQDILASHGDHPLVDREATIGIFSHTRPNAKGFLRQIKNELEGNDLLREWFPDIIWSDPRKQSPKWSEDEGIVLKRRANPKEATVEAWGLVDGQPTGKHFTHLVYDDVVTLESVTSPDMIGKTTNALAMSYNLGAEGGVRRFIGTRYHFLDTYKTVMERGTATPRQYPATVDGSVDGEPVLLTAERLAEKRRDMGPYVYGSQMLQNPIADEAQNFKREWLRYYDEPPKRDQLVVYILMDAANAKRKSSDYTAGWVVGLGKDKNVYVLDMLRDRLNLTQRATRVMDWHRKWQPLQTRYEEYGLQADIQHIQDRQAREGYRFDIVKVGGSTPKNDRIKRLIPYFEQGRVYLPRTLHAVDYQGKTVDLVRSFVEEEYAAFPVALHDDMMDSLGRLAEPDLTLTWPKEKAKPSGESGRSHSPGGWMG